MRQRLGSMAALMAAIVVMVGCSSSGGSKTSSNSSASGAPSATTASSSGQPPSWLVAAQAANELNIEGTYSTPPGNAPAPPKGKSVWIIPCEASVEGCEKPAAAAAQAAQLLGWKTTIVDGKFDPSIESATIEQAIAAKADAIITIAIDCSDIKEALINAKAAHIPTISYLGADCNDPHVGGQSEYAGSVNLGTFSQFYEDYGKNQADYIIANSDGKAKIIDLQSTDIADLYLNMGFKDEMDKCTTCSVIPVNFATVDLNGALAQKVQTALIQNPGATWLHAPYDAVVQVIANAIKTLGHGIKVTSAECLQTNLDLIRQGNETACVNATDFGWVGYALIDTVIRLLDGQTDIPPSGIGTQVVDATHNLPASGPYNARIDYVDAYKKSWGLQ